MDKLSKLVISLALLSSYLLAIISAIVVLPALWLPLGIFLAALGGLYMYRFTHKNRAVVAVGVFTNGVFIALGQYLETVVPAISIIVNIMGVILTFIMMVVWYYFKEGKRHVQVRVKNERVSEDVPDRSASENIKFVFSIIKRQRELVKTKNYRPLLAFQIAYIEKLEEEEAQAKTNAIDFILGKEVFLQRNEYDQSPDK